MASKKSKASIAEELAIDPDRLDYEWARQPMLHARYSKMAAEAKKRAREAKEDLEILRATLDKEIRSDPKKFLGDSKLTETAITNAIKLDEEYQSLTEHVIETEYTADLMEKMVYSVLQKGNALLHLVRLFLAEYYASDGEVSRTNLSEMLGDYTQRVNREISEIVSASLND